MRNIFTEYTLNEKHFYGIKNTLKGSLFWRKRDILRGRAYIKIFFTMSGYLRAQTVVSSSAFFNRCTDIVINQ